MFGELAKLPALAAHYRLHREEKPQTSLPEFLWLHYIDLRHQNDSAHNHHSLPFHTHGGLNTLQPACSLPEDSQAMHSLPALDEETLTAADFYYSRFLPACYASRLFQPPRV